jgi:hypothetical protein
MRRDLFEDFCREYVRELNRLRMEHRAGLSSARTELADGDQLKIMLKGDLAGMLSAARDSKRSPDTGDLLLQIKLVAGARNKLYRQLCWAAA